MPQCHSATVPVFKTLQQNLLVPAWTSTSAGALAAPVDYLFAVLFALVPGSMVGALVFFLAANRCAAKHRSILKTA